MKKRISSKYILIALSTIILWTCKEEEILIEVNDITPTVEIIEITNISESSATIYASISNEGEKTIIAQGICWSTNQEFIITGNYINDNSGIQDFNCVLTELTEFTKYYLRAYAIYENDTAFSNEISFTAKSLLVDYDSNVYDIVKIGDQVWMAENLKTTHYANGEEITLVKLGWDWDTLSYTDKAYCYHGYNFVNFNIHGALYTWAAAANRNESSNTLSEVQGACPDGWHLPDDVEFKQLEMHLGMSQQEADKVGLMRGTNEGNMLKSEEKWLFSNGTNKSGFNAFPSGYRLHMGNFSELKVVACFWSSSETSSQYAFHRILHNQFSEIERTSSLKKEGLSVRCIRD